MVGWYGGIAGILYVRSPVSRPYIAGVLYHTMTTVTAHDDIFTLRVPGAKEGDIVEILDTKNSPRRARLTIPMGEEFAFEWADPEPGEGDGRFVKQGDHWLIRTNGPRKTGDKVSIHTQRGVQELVLGPGAGEENLFYRQCNFAKNPTGGDPKWCVRVYFPGAKSGDIVDVAKADGSTQKQVLGSEVKPGVWTATKAS